MKTTYKLALVLASSILSLTIPACGGGGGGGGEGGGEGDSSSNDDYYYTPDYDNNSGNSGNSGNNNSSSTDLNFIPSRYTKARVSFSGGNISTPNGAITFTRSGTTSGTISGDALHVVFPKPGYPNNTTTFNGSSLTSNNATWTQTSKSSSGNTINITFYTTNGVLTITGLNLAHSSHGSGTIHGSISASGSAKFRFTDGTVYNGVSELNTSLKSGSFSITYE